MSKVDVCLVARIRTAASPGCAPKVRLKCTFELHLKCTFGALLKVNFCQHKKGAESAELDLLNSTESRLLVDFMYSTFFPSTAPKNSPEKSTFQRST